LDGWASPGVECQVVCIDSSQARVKISVKNLAPLFPVDDQINAELQLVVNG
jgi:hypothetical protein